MSMQKEPEQATLSSIEQYAAYPFHTDHVYQQGLASILESGSLASNASVEEREEVLRRTRVFYFNRKTTGGSVTVDEAREYELSMQKDQSLETSDPQISVTHPSLSTAQHQDLASRSEQRGEEETEPRILTFAELKELIETGRLDQIPNNKLIPNALNESSPSQSTAQVRKKPWEITSEVSTAIMTSTSE